MKRLIMVLTIALVFFSSCSFLPSSSTNNDILKAPILNQTQKDIYDELGKVIPDIGSVLFQYPSYQGQRSPFVFYDLDNDGTEEVVIVFYSFKTNKEELFAKVMRLNEDKKWQPFYDIPCFSNDISYINFAPLIDKNQSSLMIGWKKGAMEYLGIYSINKEEVTTDFIEPYYKVLAEDIGGDDLAEMLLVQDKDSKLVLNLYKHANGKFKVNSFLDLYAETVKVHQMLIGKTMENKIAIYIDEEIGGITSYGTEIAQINGNKLELIAGGEHKTEDEGVYWEEFAKTFRSGEMVLSIDLWEDGTIEVPHISEYTTYGQSYSDGTKELRMINYMQLVDKELVIKYNSVYNEDFEYFIHLPDKWVGNIKIVEQPQRQEWRFYKVNPSNNKTTTELLRIRAFFSTENRDEITNDDFLLGTKNLFSYYGYIPDTKGEELAITETEVKNDMFDLI